jgi:glucose-6-phosphate isomerase
MVQTSLTAKSTISWRQPGCHGHHSLVAVIHGGEQVHFSGDLSVSKASVSARSRSFRLRISSLASNRELEYSADL